MNLLGRLEIFSYSLGKQGVNGLDEDALGIAHQSYCALC